MLRANRLPLTTALLSLAFCLFVGSLAAENGGIDNRLGGAPMGSTASLEGEVSGPGGVLLPEIEVSLYRLQGSEWQFTDWQNTGGDGRYAFAGLEDGSYTLLFRDWSQTFAFSYYDGASQLDDATAIVIAGAGMTVDAQLELAGRITGALTDPGGRPLDVPLVFVFSATDEPEVLFLTNPDPETGAYDLGGLPTGDYLVQFTGRQGLDSFVSYYDGAESFADATPVPVVVGETTADIDGEIGLPPGGVISGQITDPYGRAFDHARVEALAFEDGDWLAAGSAETAFYESEFVLPLAPGSYRLRFEGVSFLQPDLPAVEFFDDVLTVEGGTDVVVGLDQTLDNFDVVVGNLAQGSLSGTVTDDASGLPLAGIEVYPAGRGGSVLWDQVVTTGIDGTYTVSGLWPGGYSIELYDPSFVYQTLRLPAPVLVGEGAVTGVDGALTVAEPGSLPGSISGRVTGPGGEPLFNVRVTAGSQDEQDPAFGFAATDSDGRYRIRSLPTGSYLLHFSAPDGFRVPEWYDDAKSRDQATPVMVVDAADSAGIDAELAPAGAIQGSVTDRFGNDFFITTADAYVPEGADWRLVASTAVVNEAEYRLDGVPVGDVRVRFSGRRLVGDPLTEVYDDVETLDEGTDVPVVGGEVTADVDAILGSPPTGAIAGQVTDGGGAGLAGIAVRVYDDRFELEVETVSETDGSYTAAGLLNGRFYVEFSDPAGVYPSEAYDDVGSLTLGTPVMVVDGGTTAGIDAALDGSRDGPGGGGMRGVVTDAETGAPLADVRVHCLAVDLSFDPPFISSVDGCSTTTGADGRYQLAGFLPAGDYYVGFSSADGFWAEAWFDDVPTLLEATPVAAALGAWTDGIDAALTPAGGISGMVTNEGGNAFPLLTVTAYAWQDGEWQPFKSAFAAFEASYELLGLPAGDYLVRFRGGSIFDPDSGIIEFYDDVPSLDQANAVSVVAGAVTQGIDAVLEGTEPELVDPGFDRGVAAWTLEVPDDSSLHHGELDLNGNSASGSAELLNRTGSGERFVLSQCVAAVGGKTYSAGGWLRVDAEAGGATARVTVDFHGEAGCGGDPLATAASPWQAGTPEWSQLTGEMLAPTGTASARVAFVLDAGQATGFDANWDALFFDAGRLFADGFESGSFSRWSSAVDGR